LRILDEELRLPTGSYGSCERPSSKASIGPTPKEMSSRGSGKRQDFLLGRESLSRLRYSVRAKSDLGNIALVMLNRWVKIKLTVI
jgi:hypothetical protein